MAQTNGGSQRFTATGVVGVSARPVTVYSYSFLSGATAGVVIFKNTNASGTERHEFTGTVSTGTTVTFGPYGKYFPLGCHLTVDGNTTYVDVDFSQMA